MAEALQNLAAYQKADEIMRICRSAVRKALAENRRLGIPNVYSLNGQIYYELPNGDYTRERPQTSPAKNQP